MRALFGVAFIVVAATSPCHTVFAQSAPQAQQPSETSAAQSSTTTQRTASASTTASSEGASNVAARQSSTTNTARQPSSPPLARNEEDSRPAEDGLRLRGGVSFGGGPIFPWGATSLSPVGGVGALNLRFGVQFFHGLGLYLQSQNSIGALGVDDGSGNVVGYAMFQSFNSALLSLTLFHLIELAAGPSADYVQFFACMAPPISCGAGEGFGLGMHARASLNLGGVQGRGPRRTAFNLGLDAHPMFFLARAGGMIATSITLGVEWY